MLVITVVAKALLFSITECKYSAVVRNSTSYGAVDMWTRQSFCYTFTQWKCMCRLYISTNHSPCNHSWCTVLGALSKINSFWDNTSSPRIFNISKWPVISRWQSLNAWHWLITVSFTVTELHSVPDSFPIPHLFTFSTFTFKDVCNSLVLSFRESGNVCKRLKLSRTSGNLLTDKSSQMIGRWTGEFFAVNEYISLNFELLTRKTRVSKEHDIMK